MISVPLLSIVSQKKKNSAQVALLLLALVGLGFVGGCSVLPAPRPVNIYLLPAQTVQSAAVPATPTTDSLPWSLRINRPAANGHLSGLPLIVLPAAHQVQVYANSVWNNPPPILLRDRLQDAFRSDGRLSSLSTDERILFADYELDSDLRAFQSEYRDGNPVAVIVLEARLIDVATRRIISGQLFTVEQAAIGAAVGDVVNALGLSADRLTQQVTEWVVHQLPAQAIK